VQVIEKYATVDPLTSLFTTLDYMGESRKTKQRMARMSARM